MFDGLADKVHGHFLGHVQVNLLFPEGIPEMLSCPIRKGNFLLGSSIFALINQVHIRLSWTILWPELVPVEKEILVSTLVVLLLIIFVVFRLTGNVIDHKVKHEIVLVPQAFDIFPISKGWIYLIIVYRRKATVTG